eukprot:scaffold5198_cov173-Amphora_coffeaeformis.AAC.3
MEHFDASCSKEDCINYVSIPCKLSRQLLFCWKKKTFAHSINFYIFIWNENRIISKHIEEDHDKSYFAYSEYRYKDAHPAHSSTGYTAHSDC